MPTCAQHTHIFFLTYTHTYTHTHTHTYTRTHTRTFTRYTHSHNQNHTRHTCTFTGERAPQHRYGARLCGLLLGGQPGLPRAGHEGQHNHCVQVRTIKARNYRVHSLQVRTIKAHNHRVQVRIRGGYVTTQCVPDTQAGYHTKVKAQ